MTKGAQIANRLVYDGLKDIDMIWKIPITEDACYMQKY